MAQVKKIDVQDAILASAFDLFAQKGYTATTMAEIARASSTTTSNLYVYFPSKLILLYAIYRPWLLGHLDKVRDAAMKYRTPRTRLRRTLLGLWRDIPSVDQCLANALVEALATSNEENKKPNDLLLFVEQFLTNLLRDVLPQERHFVLENGLLSHMVWMAFDGFAINRRLGDVRDMDALVDLFTNLLLGDMALE